MHGVDTAVNGIGDDIAENFGICLLPSDDLPSLPLDLWSGSGASGLPHDPPLAIAKLQFLSHPPTFRTLIPKYGTPHTLNEPYPFLLGTPQPYERLVSIIERSLTHCLP